MVDPNPSTAIGSPLSNGNAGAQQRQASFEMQRQPPVHFGR
jgi:hypothetical protein